MTPYNLYVAVSLWFRKHFVAIAGVTLLSAAVGFSTDRFVGGRTAEVAGRAQLIFLIMYFVLMSIFLIFRPYQGRVGAFLRSHPMRFIAVVVVTVILAFALLMIGLTVTSIVRDDI